MYIYNGSGPPNLISNRGTEPKERKIKKMSTKGLLKSKQPMHELNNVPCF